MTMSYIKYDYDEYFELEIWVDYIKISMNAYAKYQKLWVCFDSTHIFKYLLLVSVTYLIGDFIPLVKVAT